MSEECMHPIQGGLCTCTMDDGFRCPICNHCTRCGRIACTIEDVLTSADIALKWADEIRSKKICKEKCWRGQG